ncbi:amidohydrolase family protein [Krasilnikovia sp. M28-CT-15]|uniref:amidohydrolase family protein n=1 Tax=Krasilnikovia sp. M28-CT-15 TaxID=3373540 RepID=UPI0038761FBC
MSSAPGSRHNGGRFALRAARLFDGQSESCLARPLVIVDQGCIAAVVSGGETPSDLQEYDLGDTTLLPGLIDTHVHLGFDATLQPLESFLGGTEEELHRLMATHARRALAAGVTTIRDLGGRGFSVLDFRDAPRSGDQVVPHIVAAGPPITSPGGHCHFMGGEARGVDGIRAAVKRLIERGVDVIKVMGTGGSMTPGSDPLSVQFEFAELRMAVEVADDAGISVTVHAHARDGIRTAVRAGVHGLEHAKFWVPEGIAPDDATIHEIARRGIWVCPTLGSLPGAPPPPPAVAARLAVADDLLRDMHTAGVRLVAGSDAGIAPAKPHDVLPFTVRQMAAAAGMSNVEALRSATSRAADCCGLPAKGRLRPGADADILAVSGDPTRDLSAIHQVQAVFRAGKRVT